MLKKAIFAAALTLGFVTSFHIARGADGKQTSIRIEAASQAVACPDSCEALYCYCWCWGC
jgi:hypothetical protein